MNVYSCLQCGTRQANKIGKPVPPKCITCGAREAYLKLIQSCK